MFTECLPSPDGIVTKSIAHMVVQSISAEAGARQCISAHVGATELPCGNRRRLLPGSYMKASGLRTHCNSEDLIIITSEPDDLPIGVLSLESSVQGIRAA